MKTLFSKSDIADRAKALFKELDDLSFDECVEAINQIKISLHGHSPFKNEPVDCVLWVKYESVKGNDYNPNTVAPPEMKLLTRSIKEDGYTQPIVAFNENENYTVIDGFHRHRIGKENKEINARLHGYLPITAIKSERTNIKDRMASTIRHNRARGVHGVMPMTDIVADLIKNGWSDSEVAIELGMDADEVLRFKQTSGLPELFKDHQFSKSWE